MLDLDRMVNELVPGIDGGDPKMIAANVFRNERLRSAIRDCLSVCERLSVCEEEGRSLRPAFCLLEDPPRTLELPVPGYIPFVTPVRLAGGALIKLASAIDRTTSCFVVPVPARGEPAFVTGIANYPPSWLSMESAVWMDVRGPAHVRASRGDRSIIARPDRIERELRRVEIEALIPESWKQDLAMFLTTPVRKLTALPIGLLGHGIDPRPSSALEMDQLRSMVRANAGTLLAYGLEELAAGAERLHCGATFIIGPDLPDPERVLGGTRLALDCGNSMTLDRWWGSALLDALAYDCLSRLARRDMSVRSEPISNYGQLAEEYGRERARAFIAWDQDVERLARLASKDGATFLTSRLRCTAFGTSIDSSERIPFSEDTRALLEPSPDRPGRGERHRAAARAVSQNGSDTIALCVSHDGGFTLFFVRDGKVEHLSDARPL